MRLQVGDSMTGWIAKRYMDKDVKPWDLLNPNKPRSSEELHEYRFKICQGCDFFRQKTQTCRKCGCFMQLKTKLEHAKCPVGKW